MSTHMIYYKDGVKMMRPVQNREEYLALRNGGEQQQILKAVRSGDESRKSQLVQMNYSCLSNDDGTLKGSKRMSTTVGMDIDHLRKDSQQEGRTGSADAGGERPRRRLSLGVPTPTGAGSSRQSEVGL